MAGVPLQSLLMKFFPEFSPVLLYRAVGISGWSFCWSFAEVFPNKTSPLQNGNFAQNFALQKSFGVSEEPPDWSNLATFAGLAMSWTRRATSSGCLAYRKDGSSKRRPASSRVCESKSLAAGSARSSMSVLRNLSSFGPHNHARGQVHKLALEQAYFVDVLRFRKWFAAIFLCPVTAICADLWQQVTAATCRKRWYKGGRPFSSYCWCRSEIGDMRVKAMMSSLKSLFWEDAAGWLAAWHLFPFLCIYRICFTAALRVRASWWYSCRLEEPQLLE